MNLAEAQALSIQIRYRLRAEARGGRLVVADSDIDRLHRLVMADPLLGPIGRGFYLGDGAIVVAPDWTFDTRMIARARLIAVLRIEWRRTLRRWGLSR